MSIGKIIWASLAEIALIIGTIAIASDPSIHIEKNALYGVIAVICAVIFKIVVDEYK